MIPVRIASQAQIVMQHRFHCASADLARTDGYPPWDADIDRHRYLCRSCGLYLTGNQITDTVRSTHS